MSLPWQEQSPCSSSSLERQLNLQWREAPAREFRGRGKRLGRGLAIRGAVLCGVVRSGVVSSFRLEGGNGGGSLGNDPP